MPLTHEDKAISLFNSALKVAISLGLEPTKENSKEIVLNNLLAFKESLYEATTMCAVSTRQLQKLFEYYNKVKFIIEQM